MDDIPTMFSYNALVKTATGRLEIHYKNKSIELTVEGSMLMVVGTQYTYKIRPSGLAILEKKADHPTSLQTPEVTPEVTPKVTLEVTPEVTPEVIPKVTLEVTPEVIPEVIPKVTLEVTPEVTPEVTLEVTPEVIPEVIPKVTLEVTPEVTPLRCDIHDSGLKTYYMQAAKTRRGLELNTPDFVVFGNAIVSTIPLPKGTKIAVKTIKRTPGFLHVPGTKTLSFAPLEMRVPGNVGKLLVTNGNHGSNSLWSLTGPLEHGFLFYVLTQNTQRPSKCTT